MVITSAYSMYDEPVSLESASRKVQEYQILATSWEFFLKSPQSSVLSDTERGDCRNAEISYFCSYDDNRKLKIRKIVDINVVRLGKIC